MGSVLSSCVFLVLHGAMSNAVDVWQHEIKKDQIRHVASNHLQCCVTTHGNFYIKNHFALELRL